MDSIKKIWPFLLGLVLLAGLVRLLFTDPLFTKYEGIQSVRLYKMDQCFKDGQIPCRWVPGLENFYGSPIFNYAAPLPYYFGEFIFFITNNLLLSVKIMLFVSLIGSYIFMHLFISKFFDKYKVNLSAFFYSLLVFSIIVFHKDGLAVAWGLMFFPLILLSIDSLLQKITIQNFLFTSLSLSLIILSVDSAPVLISLILLWIIFRYFKVEHFTFLLVGLSSILFAVLLSSFYIIPSIFERNLIHSVSINDPLRFLPKSSAEKPQTAVDSPFQILAGDSEVNNFRQGTNWVKFETNTKTHTIIRLSTFYFPNFKIFIDGKETQVEYKNNSLGLMTIILGEGKHTIEGRLFDTPIRIISNIVTVISVILTLLLAIIQFKGVRHSINYYRRRL